MENNNPSKQNYNTNLPDFSLNEKKISVYQNINLKRRADGSLYKSRLEMKASYDNSRLPYPFAAIWNLDYCWNIVKSHFKNCFFFAVPMTLVFSYAFNPKVRTEGMKSRPFVYFISVYILVYSMLGGYFLFDSLAFCDYCKPWSSVYTKDGQSERYKEVLRSRIRREQSSIDAQNKKTRDVGLKDDEI